MRAEKRCHAINMYIYNSTRANATTQHDSAKTGLGPLLSLAHCRPSQHSTEQTTGSRYARLEPQNQTNSSQDWNQIRIRIAPRTSMDMNGGNIKRAKKQAAFHIARGRRTWNRWGLGTCGGFVSFLFLLSVCQASSIRFIKMRSAKRIDV